MSLVFCSSKVEDITFANGIASALNVPLVIESKISAAAKAAKSANSLAGFFLSVENIFQYRLWLPELESIDINLVHVVCEPDNRELIEFIFANQSASSVLFRKFEDPRTDGIHFSRTMTLSPKTSKKTAPGIQSMFPGSNIRTIELRSREQKDFLADTVLFQLQAFGCSQRVAQSVASAADELLLNAIVGLQLAAGEQRVAQEADLHASINRQLEKQLVCMQIGSQDPYIGVSVSAVNGLASRKDIFENLSRAFAVAGAGQLDITHSGFALGLALILRSGASLRFNCIPGEITEITVLLKKSQSLLEFRNQFQFVTTKFTE